MALLRWGPATAALALVALTSLATEVGSQVLTQDRALALAFPDAEVERRTAYLSQPQIDRAAELAGPDVEVAAAVVTYYVATRAGEAVGVAYFDAHRVRTLPQVLMVVLDTAGRVRRVETVSFREPPEYEAPGGWLDQFTGRSLDEGLSLKGEIANITGATLTAAAATRATRRVLALHRVITPLGRAR